MKKIRIYRLKLEHSNKAITVDYFKYSIRAKFVINPLIYQVIWITTITIILSKFGTRFAILRPIRTLASENWTMDAMVFILWIELKRRMRSVFQFSPDYPMSKIKFINMNEKIERISKWIFFFFTGCQIVGFLFTLLETAFDYSVHMLGDESFRLIFPAEWPFDWRTPFGYLIAFAVELAADIYVGRFGC